MKHCAVNLEKTKINKHNNIRDALHIWRKINNNLQ